MGADLHHVKSRGAGGGDDSWNLIPVCHRIHQEIHSKGICALAKQHAAILNWLLSNGWELETGRERWVRVLRQH